MGFILVGLALLLGLIGLGMAVTVLITGIQAGPGAH